MKPVDRLLQQWRVRRAAHYLPEQPRVLDIGSHDGAFFRLLGDRVAEGVGIDEEIPSNVESGTFRLVRGHFPQDLPSEAPFDAITMLAVLEHVPPPAQSELAHACHDRLRPGGRLIITTPAPAVDRILDVLAALKIIDGMALHQHYGFEPRQTPGIFEPAGLHLLTHERFQLGLNHLWVFERPL